MLSALGAWSLFFTNVRHAKSCHWLHMLMSRHVTLNWQRFISDAPEMWNPYNCCLLWQPALRAHLACLTTFVLQPAANSVSSVLRINTELTVNLFWGTVWHFKLNHFFAPTKGGGWVVGLFYANCFLANNAQAYWSVESKFEPVWARPL